MTRDSIAHWFGIIGGAAVGLVAHFDLFPWIPIGWQHGIEIVAFLYGIVSGKLATSPLRSKEEKRVQNAIIP